DARFEDARLDQPELTATGIPLEERRAFAEYHRVDRDAVLVNQVVLHQRRGKVGAAKHNNGLARLRLELCYGLVNMLAYQARMLPGRLGQRGREDDLLNLIQQPRHLAFLRGPDRCATRTGLPAGVPGGSEDRMLDRKDEVSPWRE